MVAEDQASERTIKVQALEEKIREAEAKVREARLQVEEAREKRASFD